MRKSKVRYTRLVNEGYSDDERLKEENRRNAEIQRIAEEAVRKREEERDHEKKKENLMKFD